MARTDRGRAVVAALALAVAACAAPAALAHGPEGGGTGYIATVAGLIPPVPGVVASVLGGDEQIQLANYSGRTVHVLAGEEGSPMRWVEIRSGRSFTWHDHRIHWERDEPPAVVQQAPDEDHKIANWRIRARVGTKPCVIEGFLGYRPPPSAAPESGGDTWKFDVPGIALAAALAIGAGARRMRRAP